MTRQAEKKETPQDEGEQLPPPPKLSPLQIAFIEQLLTGKNISKAALAAGISRRCAVRWMQPDAPVALAYERRRLALEDASTAQLQKLYDMTWQTFEAMLTGKDKHLRFAVAKLLYEGSQGVGRPAGEPLPVERLQDEEVRDIKSLLFDKHVYEREAWLSDNPLDYFKEDD